MTIRTVNLLALKSVKNSVIGNPSAKLSLAQDLTFVTLLVDCLNHPPSATEEAQGSRDDIRIEAAHIISSITYGSQEALQNLLRANALQAFLYAISNFQPSDPVPLKAAFARALRALSAAIAETVGPSQWGLRPDNSDVRVEAKVALEYLFQLDFLDIYLPLLVDTSVQTSISIAQLLASAVRNRSHRTAVTDWLPPTDRITEIKSKRGWEKPDMTNLNAPSRYGGWVAQNLTNLLRSKDSKLQEAALSALAALAKDNPYVARVLASGRSSDRDSSSPLSSVLSLTKTRSTDVQLAACLCATHIIRASASNHPVLADSSSALTVLHVVNRMIASASESSQLRTKACFILSYLATDDNKLCQTAVDRGSLEKLSTLVKSITPLEKSPEWDEDEPDSVSCLREAALTAISALSLFDNDIRHEVTDNLRLIPTIQISLSHRHVGVRYAACQCVRALSRAVAIIRTNIVDSGLGMAVFQIFKKEDEDRRVTYAALSAVCNMVNDFSPLRVKFIDQGVMPRLVQLLNSGDPALRLNALWATKNLLRKSSPDTKRVIMSHLGWRELVVILMDTDVGVQEQAWNIVRNLAEDDPGIDMVFRELGPDAILGSLTVALESRHENVVLQAAYSLANLSNGHEGHQNMIMSNTQVLSSLHSCLADANVEIRRPAVSCVLELVRTSPRRRKELNDAGIISTLRHISDVSSGVSISPGGRLSGGYATAPEDDKEVREQARQILDLLEHSGDTEF